jgi:predicted RNase H-like HicB family nuclease
MFVSEFEFVIERASDGAFWAYVPALPGCATVADSIEGVEAQLAEAIDLYLSYYRHRGRTPPGTTDAVP